MFTKTRICKFWEQGACTNGASCSFAHGHEELDKSLNGLQCFDVTPQTGFSDGPPAQVCGGSSPEDGFKSQEEPACSPNIDRQRVLGPVASSKGMFAAEPGQVLNGILVKTRMCRNWLQGGTCSYGELCSFAHGDNDMGRPAMGRAANLLSQKLGLANKSDGSDVENIDSFELKIQRRTETCQQFRESHRRDDVVKRPDNRRDRRGKRIQEVAATNDQETIDAVVEAFETYAKAELQGKPPIAPKKLQAAWQSYVDKNINKWSASMKPEYYLGFLEVAQEIQVTDNLIMLCQSLQWTDAGITCEGFLDSMPTGPAKKKAIVESKIDNDITKELLKVLNGGKDAHLSAIGMKMDQDIRRVVTQEYGGLKIFLERFPDRFRIRVGKHNVEKVSMVDGYSFREIPGEPPPHSQHMLAMQQATQTQVNSAPPPKPQATVRAVPSAQPQMLRGDRPLQDRIVGCYFELMTFKEQLDHGQRADAGQRFINVLRDLNDGVHQLLTQPLIMAAVKKQVCAAADMLVDIAIDHKADVGGCITPVVEATLQNIVERLPYGDDMNLVRLKCERMKSGPAIGHHVVPPVNDRPVEVVGSALHMSLLGEVDDGPKDISSKYSSGATDLSKKYGAASQSLNKKYSTNASNYASASQPTVLPQQQDEKGLSSPGFSMSFNRDEGTNKRRKVECGSQHPSPTHFGAVGHDSAYNPQVVGSQSPASKFGGPRPSLEIGSPVSDDEVEPSIIQGPPLGQDPTFSNPANGAFTRNPHNPDPNRMSPSYQSYNQQSPNYQSPGFQQSPMGQGGPSPMGQGGPSPMGQGGPSPMGQGGPSPMGQGGPQYDFGQPSPSAGYQNHGFSQPSSSAQPVYCDAYANNSAGDQSQHAGFPPANEFNPQYSQGFPSQEQYQQQPGYQQGYHHEGFQSGFDQGFSDPNFQGYPQGQPPPPSNFGFGETGANGGFNQPPPPFASDQPGWSEPGFGGPPQPHSPSAQSGFGGPPQQHSPSAQSGFGVPPQQHSPSAQSGFGGPPQQHSPSAQSGFGGPPQQHSPSAQSYGQVAQYPRNDFYPSIPPGQPPPPPEQSLLGPPGHVAPPVGVHNGHYDQQPVHSPFFDDRGHQVVDVHFAAQV